ncbi:hypothetical protein A6R68_13502, partial [Neotoma lepida]
QVFGYDSLNPIQPALFYVFILYPQRLKSQVTSARDKMWFGGWYDYGQLPRERVLLQSHPLGGNLRLINVVPTPLVDKRSFLLPRPDERGYGSYYGHVNYRECDEGHGFSYNRRSGPPYRGCYPGYQWTRYEYPTRRKPEYRAMRDGFGGKHFYSCHYSRQQCPHKWGTPFLRESHIGGKDSLHRVSGPSRNNRHYPPKQSRVHSSHQSRHRCKERAIQFLKSSSDTSSSISSSEVFKKSSRLTEKEHAEAASKWANEKPKKSEENNLAEISEYETRPKSPLLIDQTEEPKSNTTDGAELYEDSQVSRRTKAIVSKMTEIEKAYRQVLETFVMVVETLVEKDPSLERPIKFAMKQSFHEIGERHVEELKHFIAEYDKSTQDFGDPFKKN